MLEHIFLKKNPSRQHRLGGECVANINEFHFQACPQQLAWIVGLGRCFSLGDFDGVNCY